MGNRITNKQVNDNSLKMSNGWTSVIMAVLALSACDAAELAWEKRFAQQMVYTDQSYRGRGTVGFDISEIGWNPEGFEEQKQHVLKVIDKAINEHRWKDLSYSPPPEMTKGFLKQFRDLIGAFQQQHIVPEHTWSLDDKDLDISLCLRHHVYLNIAGCIICND
jgi:hypothetical protein